MGALHSPALLMRSGIGPAAELSALGIDVVADRRGVGKHLMEHPGVNFGCYLKRDARLPAAMRRQMFAGLRWSSGLADCPAGDMYIIPTNKAAWHAVGHRLGLIMMWVNRSYSTGEVRLTSADPAAKPDVDFNMCSDWRDMDRLVMGVRHDDPPAGASGHPGHGRTGFPDQLQRPRPQICGLRPLARAADVGRRHFDGHGGAAAPRDHPQPDRRRARPSTSLPTNP